MFINHDKYNLFCRYVALKGSKYAYYDSKDVSWSCDFTSLSHDFHMMSILYYQDFTLGKPIHVLDMRLANVKPDMTGKNYRFTITMPNQRSYV